jgi:hypothetical protein
MGAQGSQSTQQAQGAQASDSFGFNNASSTAFNRSNTFVDPTQQPFRADLFSQAQGVTNPAMIMSEAGKASQGNLPGYGRAIGTAMSLADPSSQIAAQSQALETGLGNLWRNQINPSIQSDTIRASGGLGTGRQGVAQGVAAGELGNAYATGLGDIVAGANAQSLGAAQSLPGMLQSQFQNAMSPRMAGIDSLASLAQILGGPTILSSGQGGSQSVATGANASSSRGFNQSSGKSSSFGFSWS